MTNKMKPAEVQKLYHSTRTLFRVSVGKWKTLFLSFPARDSFIKYLPQPAVMWVPGEKIVIPQHTRVEDSGPADGAALRPSASRSYPNQAACVSRWQTNSCPAFGGAQTWV